MKVGDLVRPRYQGFAKSLGVVKEVTKTSVIVVWSSNPNTSTSYNIESTWLEVVNA
mgnify:CR=1 FL=1